MKKNLTKILLMIAVITAIIGAKVYADYIMNASEVEYTKSDSTKVSVKAALDDLYNKSQQNVNVEEFFGLELSQTILGLAYTGTQTITITNPVNLGIEVESSDSTVATVTKDSDTQITINALSKSGNAVIYVRVIGASESMKIKEINVTVWEDSVGMPISFAKTIDTSNIRKYQGTQVDYNPEGGGVWRIFYYDETGKYGDGAGTIYIKRDYNSSTTVKRGSYTNYYTNSSNKSEVLADMQKFNPQWSVGDGSIDASNENIASYFCYHGAWTKYVESGVGEYAIGSPSVEMYIDAWNQYIGYKQFAYKCVEKGTALEYYTESSNGSANVNAYAYAPAKYSYSTTKLGTVSVENLITTVANSIFMTSGSSWWLASPNCYIGSSMCYVRR